MLISTKGILHVVIVKHALERVTRTTFGICPSFQLLQILFTAFAGENLDVQPHGAAPLRRGEDLVNEGINKLLGDLSTLAVMLGVPKYLADALHIAAELLAGLLLLPQFGKLLLGGFDIGITLCCHGLKISRGDTVEGYQF